MDAALPDGVDRSDIALCNIRVRRVKLRVGAFDREAERRRAHWMQQSDAPVPLVQVVPQGLNHRGVTAHLGAIWDTV